MLFRHPLARSAKSLPCGGAVESPSSFSSPLPSLGSLPWQAPAPLRGGEAFLLSLLGACPSPSPYPLLERGSGVVSAPWRLWRVGLRPSSSPSFPPPSTMSRWSARRTSSVAGECFSSPFSRGVKQWRRLLAQWPFPPFSPSFLLSVPTVAIQVSPSPGLPEGLLTGRDGMTSPSVRL